MLCCFVYHLASTSSLNSLFVCFPAGEQRASRLWRGRPSTTPCTRARPQRATATTTAAILKLLFTAAPAQKPQLTSAVRRYDTSMRTVNWRRRWSGLLSLVDLEKMSWPLDLFLTPLPLLPSFMLMSSLAELLQNNFLQLWQNQQTQVNADGKNIVQILGAVL